MNALPPLPLTDGCLFVDNSGFFEGVSTCDRLVEYRFLHKRILAGDKPSLAFGSSQHLGLEYRYVKYGNRQVDDVYYNDMAGIFTQFFAEHPVPVDDWRSLNWAMNLLRKHNERYNIEGFNLLKYDSPIDCSYCEGTGKVPHLMSGPPAELNGVDEKPCLWCSGTGKRTMMVEMPFAIPLFDFPITHPVFYESGASPEAQVIPVIYTGRIDLPVSIDGQIFVMDHKTTSMLGQSFFDDLRMSSQQKGYVWAFQQLTGQNVAGYIVNAIRTKEPPQYVLVGKESVRGGKAQSPAQWWQESLQRERFPISQSNIVEWKHNTIDLVEEFFWHYQRGYMPMKTKLHCTAYGKCPYYEVCRLIPEDRLLQLQSGMFANNEWSPLNKITHS